MAVLLFLLWIIWNGKVNAEIILFVLKANADSGETLRFFCVMRQS